MRELGLDLKVIRAGKANMFLSPVFRSTLATLCGARIELFNTDGALGAARGGALGAGLYADACEAFAQLELQEAVEPVAEWAAPLEEAYFNWKNELNKIIKD